MCYSTICVEVEGVTEYISSGDHEDRSGYMPDAESKVDPTSVWVTEGDILHKTCHRALGNLDAIRRSRGIM